MNNLNENYKAIELVAPQQLAATASSTGVSVEQYEGDAMVILTTGAVAGTSPTLDVIIEGSDTVGGTYTTIGTFGQVTAANKCGAIGIYIDKSTTKFIRATQTLGGSSTPSVFSAVTLLVRPFVGSNTTNPSTPA